MPQQNFNTVVYLYANGYGDSETKTGTYTVPKLSDPVLTTGSVTTSTGCTTGSVGYGYPYKMEVTIKNNNSVAVKTEAVEISGRGSD